MRTPPYINQPGIPDQPETPGTRTIHEYRINRPRTQVSTFRRLVGYGIVR
jgi:hypothetical protein